jgi:hypothetical protein
MKKKYNRSWKRYGFEFLSIFIAVLSAFALNNWNDQRKSELAEKKILLEISQGLEKDLLDITTNEYGHQTGIAACRYFRLLLKNEAIANDSSAFYYAQLTRDFISMQNLSGYETLKSRGLELISNDSLRKQIIQLYEYQYTIIRKLEEQYAEGQFHQSYHEQLSDLLAGKFVFNEQGKLKRIQQPLALNEIAGQKLLMILWKIEFNRQFALNEYALVRSQISQLQKAISLELDL